MAYGVEVVDQARLVVKLDLAQVVRRLAAPDLAAAHPKQNLDHSSEAGPGQRTLSLPV